MSWTQDLARARDHTGKKRQKKLKRPAHTHPTLRASIAPSMKTDERYLYVDTQYVHMTLLQLAKSFVLVTRAFLGVQE